MSLTLKIASATNYILGFVGKTTSGQYFQKVGTSFVDLCKVAMGQNVGRTGTAKSRVNISYPFAYVDAAGVTRTDHIYGTLTYTVPETCPLSKAEELFWLVQTAAAAEETRQLVVNRAFTGA